MWSERARVENVGAVQTAHAPADRETYDRLVERLGALTAPPFEAGSEGPDSPLRPGPWGGVGLAREGDGERLGRVSSFDGHRTWAHAYADPDLLDVIYKSKR